MSRSTNYWGVTSTQTPYWMDVGWWDGDEFVSYVDNPVLTGSVDVCGMTNANQLLPNNTGYPWYADLIQYGRVDRVLTATQPALSYELGNVSGWVTMALGGEATAYLEELPLGQYSPLDESRTFLAATALPDDYTPVTFSMTESANSWPTPSDIMPAPLTARLDDQVIVIPVNFHIFGDPSTGQVDGLPATQMSQGYFWQQIDPGRTSSRGVTYAGAGPVDANSLASTWAAEATVILPDSVWTQCDIQFRIRTVEHIDSEEGLDDTLMSEDECSEDRCNPSGFPDIRLNPHVTLRSGDPGFHVYVGGDIGSACAVAGTVAYTCGPGSPSCGTHPTSEDYVAITARGLFDFPSVLAHEFGHMLGLQHTGESCAHGSVPGSLMDAGGIQDLEDAGLSEEQCDWARCVALQWMQAWDTGNYSGLGSCP